MAICHLIDSPEDKKFDTNESVRWTSNAEFLDKLSERNPFEGWGWDFYCPSRWRVDPGCDQS